MGSMLTEKQRGTLRALCDTFVPCIRMQDDPTGFWARKASDIGVDVVLEKNLTESVPEGLRTGLLGFLDILAGKNFASCDQDAREKLLDRLAQASPDAARAVVFFQKQVALLNYGLPETPVGDPNYIVYGSPQGQNPNWEVMGYPGPVSLPPQKPKDIQTIAPSNGNFSMEVDVCIVGSGAGGAMIAAQLSGRGMKVLVLESGGHYNSADFRQLELWGYRHLWYKGGATPTANGTVTLLAGGSLGGGTEINWMNCVRTPDLVRANWAQEFGIDGVDTPAWDQYMDGVEKRIMSSQQCSFFNAQNLRMREGCAKLGYLSRQTHTNWDPKKFNPLVAGYTGFGDQSGGKQTARRTFLVDAFKQGAQFMVNCRVDRICVEQGRATGVEGTYLDPQGRQAKVTVKAKQVVVAGGSLESPALLLRSRIGGPAVGKYFRVQPGGAVYGLYAEKQKGWWGSPMTTNCEQFTNTGDGFGFYMEIPAFGPGFVASVIPWSSGRQHKEMMSKVPYISTFIWFLRDRGYGQITIDADGNSVPVYQLSDEVDQKNFRHATAEAIRIHEAAGAQQVLFSLGNSQIVWKRGQDLEAYIRNITRQPLLDGAQPMISAHQLCTCRMGKDPSISVANTNGELYDVKGVWVGDASALPTALGANPMVTIMSMAHRTADRMCDAAGAPKGTSTWSGTASNGPAAPASGLQFCHIIELSVAPGQAKTVIDTIGNEAIPRIIQPADGFIDEVVLLSLEDPNHVTAFSFWRSKEDSDRFDGYGFSAVTNLLEKYLAAPPERRPFTVGASTNPRIRGWVNMTTQPPAGASDAIQFCHILELTAKPGQSKTAIDIIGNQSIPQIIRPAEGFIDEIVLQSLTDPDHVTAFSFWRSKEDSDRFDGYGFAAVSNQVQDALAAPPLRRPFAVGVSTNPRIQGWALPRSPLSGQQAATSPGSPPPVQSLPQPNMSASPAQAGGVVEMTMNMLKGMVNLMTMPASMLGMGGAMPGAPSGGMPSGSAGPSCMPGPRPASPNTLQFCHIIELTAQPGQAKAAIDIIGNQAIPRIIQPAQGFIDEIVLLSLDDPNHVTAFSFWRSKDDSDRFDAYGFDAVTLLVKSALAGPPQRRPFVVGASTNPRICGWTKTPMPPAGSAAMGNVAQADSGGSLTGAASGMMRGMINMMTLPLSMMGGQGLAGAPQAMNSAATMPGVQTAPASGVLQFCHILELTANPGQAKAAIDIIGEQAIPRIIQPASGFIDEIVLLSLDDPNHVTAFSFWRSKEDSDRFDGYGFDAVTQLVKSTLAAPPNRRPFIVGASTNPRISGWPRGTRQA